MSSTMTDPPLKYVECAVTLSEVPEEISLTISISNCLYRCHGCHSPYLQQDVGDPLQCDLDALIMRYKYLITCVCLMGEGRNEEELAQALRIIRKHGLKACQYSGSDTEEPFRNLLPLLDYLKLGSFRQELGGLNQPDTNQRFYRVKDGRLIDITNQFWRKRI